MRVLAVALTAAAIVAVGCSKKAGDACTTGALCQDAETQLVCDGGRYLASPCRGKDGCRREKDTVLCDTSANRVGDPCAAADENEGACSTDGKTLLECSKGAYRAIPCGGPGGCTARDGRLSCDRSRGSVGDDCASGGACSLDGRQLLACVKGKLALHMHCKGPDGCAPKGAGQIACDTSRVEVGDACSVAGSGACGIDGRQWLQCTEGTMAVLMVCRGEGGCQVAPGGAVGCVDPTVGQVGDPCPGGVGACSVAHDAFLTCKEGVFVEATRCRCAARDGGVGCL